MKLPLSMKNREIVRNFFENDKSLSDTFIDLFNYQFSLCEDIVFDNRGSIIGFGCPGEHLRCYVSKTSKGYLLKIKTCSEALEFKQDDFERYKELIKKQFNCIYN